LNKERINIFTKAFSSLGAFEGRTCVEIDEKL